MAKYKTIGMLATELNHDAQLVTNGIKVPYMSTQDRMQYLVTVVGGRLHRGGAPLDTTSAPNRTFLFVMDEDGRIYSAPASTVHHHSAFMAGRAVAAAGEILVESGTLKAVFDQSGHYQPPRDYTDQFLKELKGRQVPMGAVDLTGITSAYKSDRKKAMKDRGMNPRNRVGAVGIDKKYY